MRKQILTMNLMQGSRYGARLRDLRNYSANAAISFDQVGMSAQILKLTLTSLRTPPLVRFSDLQPDILHCIQLLVNWALQIN